MSDSDKDILFGQLAVKRGLIATDELEEALALQRRLVSSGSAKPLGEILVELGYLTRKQANRLLRDQQEKTGATKTIGHFEVLAKLGEGGMGAVYLAKMIGPPIRGGVIKGPPEQIEEGALVALKILPPRLARDEGLLIRFRREVEVLSSLQHPNIVRSVDWGKADGLHFLAMEFIQGENAYQKIERDGPMSERTVAEIGLEIARALEYAHRKGIVHRDIKPENIIIDLSGVARLTDFGLVSLREAEEHPSLTRAGMTVGTPYYISPEQAQGDKDIDPRSDLYSLGATLFHLLCAQVPFEGDEAAVIMLKHIVDPIPDPRDHNPRVSPEMSSVVMKLMAKSPRDRYPSAADLAEDLNRILRGVKPVMAKPKKPRPSLPTPRRVSASRTRLSSAAVPKSRRTAPPILAGAAFAFILLAMGLGLGLHLGTGSHTVSTAPAENFSLISSPTTEPPTSNRSPSPRPSPAAVPPAHTSKKTIFSPDTVTEEYLSRYTLRKIRLGGRTAVALPKHSDSMGESLRLIIAGKERVVKAPSISSRLSVEYAARNVSQVIIAILGRAGNVKFRHRNIRRPVRDGGGWERLSVPLTTVGVLPDEDFIDITLFFRAERGNASAAVSEVALETGPGKSPRVLFDITFADLRPSPGWELRPEGLFCTTYGGFIDIAYTSPKTDALLVIGLIGHTPSTAVLKIGKMEHSISMASWSSSGAVTVLPFHGPPKGSMRLKLFPEEKSGTGFYRAVLYELP